MKIKNIAPYSSKLVKAPNSPVGARIKCRITAVKSKQLELE
jgi:hypothetical protein